jgi:hypothetical protein
MKSIKMLVGTLVLAAMALAPVANAAEMLRPLTCNQSLVNCIDTATETFDCCTYGADSTTEGLLSGYCEQGPVPDLQTAAPARPTSVPACLAAFNATTLLCNGAYAVCLVLHPSAPAKNAQ